MAGMVFLDGTIIRAHHKAAGASRRSRRVPSMAPALLDHLPGAPGWVVGDRGYASHDFRERVWDSGACPAIPSKRNGESGRSHPVACPEWIDTNRNLVERLWTKLKEWRAVATRYEKTAISFMGILCLAATADWLN